MRGGVKNVNSRFLLLDSSCQGPGRTERAAGLVCRAPAGAAGLSDGLAALTHPLRTFGNVSNAITGRHFIGPAKQSGNPDQSICSQERSNCGLMFGTRVHSYSSSPPALCAIGRYPAQTGHGRVWKNDVSQLLRNQGALRHTGPNTIRKHCPTCRIYRSRSARKIQPDWLRDDVYRISDDNLVSG